MEYSFLLSEHSVREYQIINTTDAQYIEQNIIVENMRLYKKKIYTMKYAKEPTYNKTQQMRGKTNEKGMREKKRKEVQRKRKKEGRE